MLPVTRSRNERGSSGGGLVLALALAVVVLVLFTWYLDSSLVASSANADNTAGWFAGLLNGFAAVPSFVVGLFNDDYGIYRSNNTGGWYDFWFLVGIGAIFGGASSSR